MATTLKAGPALVPLFDVLRRQAVHIWRWDATAVAVPSRGNPLGEKYRTGALKCVLCKALESFVADWASCDCCPGWVEPVPAGWTLDGPAPAEAVPVPLEEAA